MGFIRPSKVLEQLSLKENMLAAEFGCGAGQFTLELAKRLSNGKVYGLDIQEEPLSVLKREALSRGLYNVETIRCDLETEGASTLPDNLLDLVLIPNVLFEIEERSKTISEAARILKPGGQLLVVDWEEKTGFGPDQRFRVPKKEVQKRAEEKGFVLEKELSAGSFHWAMLFKKR